MKNYTITELVSTGKYDETKMSKFYANQLALSNGNTNTAEAMVRIYQHNFLIRTPKSL